MQRADLERLLLDIDEEAGLLLGSLVVKPRVVIVGGAAFLLRDITARKMTHDVDVYEVADVLVDILAKYPALNGAVAAYCDNIPYNFEDRLVPLELHTKAVEFVTPSVEDLIVMKLYADRPNDIQDIDSAVRSNAVDWSLLEKLVYGDNEAKASALSDARYRQMTDAYERLKQRCGYEPDV